MSSLGSWGREGADVEGRRRLGQCYELRGEGTVDRQALYASYAKSCQTFGVKAIK